MLIERQIKQLTISSDESIINALQKMCQNGNREILLIAESGVLEGVFTDGDLRHWLARQKDADLNSRAINAANRNFISARSSTVPEKIAALFSEKIRFIPLLDQQGRLVAVARKEAVNVKIGDFALDGTSPVFTIAEIGNNHNGSLALAKQLIDAAVVAGADCAKFQMRDLKSLYNNAGNADDISQDLGSQYTLDLLSRFQLDSEELFAAFDYCKLQGILPLCTPWDLESLALLEEYGMEGYKVASADLTNHDLLRALAQTGKPLICSTGMATEQEISEAVNLLKQLGAMYVLLHCNSTYPAPFKDVNLNYLDRLKEIGNCPIGYSGHERGIHVSIAAVAKGAKVIEKHFTLDKSMEGNDHKVSLLPEEFVLMVEGIRQVEQSMGNMEERKPSQGELMNRVTLAKSLIANCDIQPGQLITASMIDVKSPGKGIQPNRKADLIGKSAQRQFKAGDFFYPSDLEDEQIQARSYSFKRPWGVPVRYHDFKAILAKSNPDFLEFHLSYKDMDVDVNKYFDRVYDLDLVVHSPDLFSGDFILNLASEDEAHRRRSIQELQRVVDTTRSLKPFFSKATKPLIVASVGGFTQNSFVSAVERDKLYQLVAESLAEIDADGVEILPQTLPPFPWYFGGQLYLNLFVTPQDTIDFCKKYNYRVCLDISHSKLACNYHHLSFKKFIQQVGNYAAHLHIVDAAGVDGEGLQIGEGEVDFLALAEDLEETAPRASFIPEIWQGHTNEGEGFWIALARLEKTFANSINN